jgi:hypothetical protein
MEDLIQRLVDNKAEQNNTIDLNAYERGIRDAIAALSDRPLTVIAPTIEWGEWHSGGCDSKCGKYILFEQVGGGIHARVAFGKGLNAEYGNTATKSEAIAACQADRQSRLDKSLVGCKVEVWRDLSILGRGPITLMADIQKEFNNISQYAD